MKKYELLLVLPGTLDDSEATKRAEEIKTLVADQGAVAIELHVLGKNRLAYPIRHIRYGYFYTLVFEAEPKQINALEKKLQLLRDPLRTFISIFNTTLTAAQKIVYSTDETGVTTMHEREHAPVIAPMQTGQPVLADVPVKMVPERPAEKLNIEEITKKLDDIMSNDVISGV